MPKSEQWYRSRKLRTQKKYVEFLGTYLTPREFRVYFIRKERLRNDKWRYPKLKD